MTTMFAVYSEPHDALLARIKANLALLTALQQEMAEAETAAILRLYNSNLRVYDLRLLVERAVALFRTIAGGGELALPFEVILQEATNGRLDLRTRMWVLSALPTLTTFYHCQFMVEQHVTAGRELERAPDVLPAGWAAVLCLYRLN